MEGILLTSMAEANAALDEAGARADPSRRRANILVSGLRLENTRGRVLEIGETRVRVGGELTPCERMEEIAAGLQAAMRSQWRGGVFGQVSTPGVVRVGDVVRWTDADEAK